MIEYNRFLHTRRKKNPNPNDDFYERFAIVLIIFCFISFIFIFRCICINCQNYNWFRDKKVQVNLKKDIIIINPDNSLMLGTNTMSKELTINKFKTKPFYNIDEITIDI